MQDERDEGEIRHDLTNPIIGEKDLAKASLERGKVQSFAKSAN